MKQFMNGFGEKRQLPRWLCDRNFSVSVIIDDHHYPMSVVNFNHLGIGLFCGERLPEVVHCTLALSYHSDWIQLRDERIPVTIVYANETEVGSDYGLKFELENSSTELQEALLEIENLLATKQCHGDRYGLFG